MIYSSPLRSLWNPWVELANAEKFQGVIKVELNIDSKTYNINKNVNVEFLQLNETNSFNYKDLENLQ